MLITRLLRTSLLSLALATLVTACGGAEEPTDPVADDAAPVAEAVAPEPALQAIDDSDAQGEQAVSESTPVEDATANSDTNDVEATVGSDTNESVETAADESDEETIDPEELTLAGTIELKQYTVAWVGSGTMGGGTLTVEGKDYPFKIAGLGIGGFGASTIDATGVVYDMPDLDAFPGTYGNARLGLTAGESGGGKLWLKSTTGVVIELESEMRGLALAGGVDGIIIEWDEAEESSFDRARDSTEETVGEGIEYGAEAVQKGVDGVKGWFKKDE